MDPHSMSISWERFVKNDDVPYSGDFSYIDMQVTVVPDWNVSVFISWEPPLPLDPGATKDILYYVYSSESELGPFVRVLEEPTTDTSVFTRYQIGDHKTYEQYFTVESIYPDGTIYRSNPFSPSQLLPTWQRLRHRDIIRRERILLEKFVGMETIIFVPKHHGLRCTQCWDPLHHKVLQDHCETCYGTSYEGGYETGMRTLMQYSSIDPQMQNTYVGITEPITTSAWTVAYPYIPPHAMILRVPDRKVFRCEGHQGSTEMLGNMQRQTVVLSELSRNSVETRLFNNTNVKDVLARPSHVHQ